MRIDRLRVENFRCFNDREWRFAPGFNVLIGDNGAGKTAVLDALAVALDPVVYKASGMPARVIRSDDVRLQDAEPQFPVAVEATGEYDAHTLTWRRTLSSKPNAKTTNAETKDVRRLAESLFERKRDSDPVVAPVVSYYTTGRLWRQKREVLEKTAAPGSKLRGYNFALDAEANDNFLFRWFKTTQLAAMQSVFETGKPHNPLLSAIQHAISMFMEGEGKYFSFDISMNTVVAGDESGNNRIPFRMLSDGQRNVAALVMDLGYRCVTLNPHLGLNALAQTPGVVLLDEIDLHLHPKWQRRIVNDLREVFPLVQFFCTTHSPLIIQSLKPGEVIDLNGGNSHDYFRQSVEEILTDEMGLRDVRRSKEYEEMMHTAERYYALLENEKNPDAEVVKALQRKLDELTLPYHDNPAYRAYRNFLEQRLLVTAGDCG